MYILLTGACRGFLNRCEAKNSARQARVKFHSSTTKCVSATPIFWLLRHFGYVLAMFWLFFVALRILSVAPTVGEKDVALMVGEKTSLI